MLQIDDLMPPGFLFLSFSLYCHHVKVILWTHFLILFNELVLVTYTFFKLKVFFCRVDVEREVV